MGELLERITAEELTDYYLAHQLEPWGETRADMRTSAGLGVLGGVSGWRTLWPYVESAEDVLAEFAALEKELLSNDGSKHNCDQAGRPDGDAQEGL